MLSGTTVLFTINPPSKINPVRAKNISSRNALESPQATSCRAPAHLPSSLPCDPGKTVYLLKPLKSATTVWCCDTLPSLMSRVSRFLLSSVTFSASFVYGLHISQTYDLPDVMRSAGAFARFFTGDSVLPKKKRRDQDEDDNDR